MLRSSLRSSRRQTADVIHVKIIPGSIACCIKKKKTSYVNSLKIMDNNNDVKVEFKL